MCRRLTVHDAAADGNSRTHQSAGLNVLIPLTSDLNIFRISPHVSNADDAVRYKERKNVFAVIRPDLTAVVEQMHVHVPEAGQ